jgi:hypothetical protein
LGGAGIEWGGFLTRQFVAQRFPPATKGARDASVQIAAFHTHTHTLSLSISLASVSVGLLICAIPAVADDVGPPDEPAIVSESLHEVAVAADIAPGVAGFELLLSAAQQLLLERNGVDATVIDGRVTGFYGGFLAFDADAADAEQVFWADHAEAFGVAGLDLIVTRSSINSDLAKAALVRDLPTHWRCYSQTTRVLHQTFHRVCRRRAALVCAIMHKADVTPTFHILAPI